MENDKILNWKRIEIPKETFDINDFSYVKAEEDYKNTQKIETEIIEKDWICDFPKEINDKFNNTKIEKIKLENDSFVKREIVFKDKEILAENLYFELEENAKSKVYLDYYSDKVENKVVSRLHFKLGKNSELEINRLQRLSDKSIAFFELLIDADEDSKVILNDIQMGGKYKAITAETHLQTKAKAIYNPLFLGDTNSFLDLSYTVRHIGRRANALIEGRGILKSKSQKVFRGNLYFDRGSKKSVAREEERCILFDDDIKSDSIPALMCSEDDVIGEHAASVGKFDENDLFYIMSRGFSKEEAKILISNALFSEIIESIELKEFSERIENEIERRFGEL